MAGTSPPALSKSMFTVLSFQTQSAAKQKTRWSFLRQRADECFVQRESMHTSSGAAYGRDGDGGDAPESSYYKNRENRSLCQPRLLMKVWRAKLCDVWAGDFSCSFLRLQVRRLCSSCSFSDEQPRPFCHSPAFPRERLARHTRSSWDRAEKNTGK